MRALLSLPSTARRGRALLAGLMIAGLFFGIMYPQSTRALGQITAQQDISNTSDMSEAPQIALGGGRLAALWGERAASDLGFEAARRCLEAAAGVQARTYEDVLQNVDLIVLATMTPTACVVFRKSTDPSANLWNT